jgi:hypothetical protein
MPDPILSEYGVCTPKDILNETVIQKSITKLMRSCVRIYHKQFSKNTSLLLNVRLLRESVESSYCDLYRLKFFRGVHQEDTHKRSAFSIKWLSKIKPIQNIGQDTTSKAIYANELFAINIGLNILEISPKQLYHKHRVYFANLIYLLHFHACDPEQLASEMYLLDKLMNT